MTLNLNIAGELSLETRRVAEGLRRGEMIRAAARGVANETREFYAGLERTRPNKQNWPRQHFWADTRRSVQNPTVKSLDAATVSINKLGLRQRVEGGYIRPKNGRKYLTLPATAEAYGKRAGEFGNLRFGFAENRYGNLAPALVDAGQQKVSFGRRRKDGTHAVKPGEDLTHKVFFWLVRKVYQPADPTAFPTEAQLKAAAIRGANEWTAAVTAQAQNNPPPQTGGAA